MAAASAPSSAGYPDEGSDADTMAASPTVDEDFGPWFSDDTPNASELEAMARRAEGQSFRTGFGEDTFDSLKTRNGAADEVDIDDWRNEHHQ